MYAIRSYYAALRWAVADGLRVIVAPRHADGQRALAAAHSFSCHSFLLRRWLQAGGIDSYNFV